MTSNAAQAILKAINKMHEEEFNEMQTIATQFMWCSYYFYGMNLDTISTGKYKYCDFRSDEEYKKFAAKYNADRRYLYINNNGYVNAGDFEQCCKTLVATVDSMTSLNALNSIAMDNVIREIAAIEYFGKTSSFQSYFYEVHSGTKEIYRKLKEKFNNSYNQGYKDIQTFTMIPASEFKKYNAGVISSECSFAPESLKKRYNEIKSHYEDSLKQLYNIILDSPNLTICYNNATVGNTTVGTSNQMYQYVNVNQVLSCAGELLGKQLEKNNNEEFLLQVKEIVPELVDKKLKELGNIKLKFIILFILIFILFIICLYNMGISIKSILDLKKYTIRST